MIRSKLHKLSILMTVLVCALLAAPVLAVTAHSSAAAAVTAAEDHHGHVHDDFAADIHDAIDHVHDVPAISAVMHVHLALPPVSWGNRKFAIPDPAAPDGPERPPRSQV